MSREAPPGADGQASAYPGRVDSANVAGDTRIEAPPARFNMSRYCVGPAPHRPPDKTGLIVAHGAGGESPLAPATLERWTYGELAAAVGACARGLLAAGLRPGERLVLRLPGQSTYPLLFFGAIAAGIVAVPTSSQLTPREFRFIVEDCRASAVAIEEPASSPGPPSITPKDVARWRRTHAHHDTAAADEPTTDNLFFADTAADDPAFLVYTSGTTGSPKGVLHAQRSAWGRRPMYAGWYGLTAADVMLHAGALNWTYTLGVGLTDPWAVGATAVVYDGPRDPAVWPPLIEATGATMFAAVPGVYRQLLNSGADLAALRSLRHGLTAGEALPPAVRQAWLEATGTDLFEALGMSEISTFISFSPTTPSRPGSPGRPQPGRRIAVLPAADGVSGDANPGVGAGAADRDEPDAARAPDVPLPPGEIGLLAVHRSDPGLMLRYWDRPEEDAASTRGDWFVSGDLVHVEPDGYVVHHGRNDDVMTSMGYRVSPLEVEAALTRHPAVAEAGCAEVEVRQGVRIIVAFVVLAPEADPAIRDNRMAAERFERDLIARAREELAAYKCPRRIVVVPALPRTANGKIRRRDLHSLATA